jgi:hypothetical protein
VKTLFAFIQVLKALAIDNDCLFLLSFASIWPPFGGKLCRLVVLKFFRIVLIKWEISAKQ